VGSGSSDGAGDWAHSDGQSCTTEERIKSCDRIDHGGKFRASEAARRLWRFVDVRSGPLRDDFLPNATMANLRDECKDSETKLKTAPTLVPTERRVV
jgi:hypothetical protein